MEYKAKQSRNKFIVASIAAVIVELVFLGATIICLVCLCEDNQSYDDIVLNAICFGGGVGFTISLLSMHGYMFYTFRHQTDTFYKDKMCREMGKKIIFELQYKDIVSIKDGMLSSYFFLNGSIVMKNGKKGPRTLIQHYTEKDLEKIKQIILESKSTTTE